jgi:hypothetical protein
MRANTDGGVVGVGGSVGGDDVVVGDGDTEGVASP